MGYNIPSQGPKSVTQHCRLTIPKTPRWYTAGDLRRHYHLPDSLCRKLVKAFGREVCRQWVIDEETFRRIGVDEQTAAASAGAVK